MKYKHREPTSRLFTITTNLVIHLLFCAGILNAIKNFLFLIGDFTAMTTMTHRAFTSLVVPVILLLSMPLIATAQQTTACEIQAQYFFPDPPKKGDSLDWAAAKQFARDVCSQMASESPERYLINMSKAKRTGKIFLDYLRNDQFSTAVAPLSREPRCCGRQLVVPMRRGRCALATSNVW